MDDFEDFILVKVFDVFVFDRLHFFFGHCLVEQILKQFLGEVILVLRYQQIF